MPVSFILNPRENTYLIGWEITESVSQMQERLHDRLQDWQVTPEKYKNSHWLATRLALLHHFRNEEVDLIKDAFNKPHLHVDGHPVFVSITHSFEKAAVAISTDRPVAIDMEKPDKRILRVQHKFCTEAETRFVESLDEPEIALTIIWSAKETMYKWYGKKALDFKKNLHIAGFIPDDNTFIVPGKIIRDQHSIPCPVYCRITQGYILTWMC